jgi:hypothetical protein
MKSGNLNARFIKETMDPNIEQSVNGQKWGESSLAGLQEEGQRNYFGKSTGSQVATLQK